MRSEASWTAPGTSRSPDGPAGRLERPKQRGAIGPSGDAFDVFVTVDQGIRYQQNLVGLKICVAVLVARSNDIRALELLVPKLLEGLQVAAPGEVIRVAG